MKLDTFLNTLSKKGSCLMPLAENVMRTANRKYGIKKESAVFELKDYTDTEADVRASREVDVDITTIAKDRDNEVVFPEGLDLQDYRLLPVVLFAHKYDDLAIGKNISIKPDRDKSPVRLSARTRYTSKDANPFGFQVYTYRAEDMPLGESIGFVPVEYITEDDSKLYSKVFDIWARRASEFMKLHNRTFDPDDRPSKFYIKAILLEYSDVCLPSNQYALSRAVAKGIISQAEAKRYRRKADDDMIELSDELVELIVERLNR